MILEGINMWFNIAATYNNLEHLWHLLMLCVLKTLFLLFKILFHMLKQQELSYNSTSLYTDPHTVFELFSFTFWCSVAVKRSRMFQKNMPPTPSG
jgi:hypothetical protein